MKEGQSFGDYWRMGFRLGSWIMLVAVPLLLVVWPS
jgi:di/tricarboxylate transporter